MKKFWKIFKFELKGYLTNKVFIGVTLVLVLVLGVVMSFPRITKYFKDDTPADKSVMLIVNDSESEDIVTAFQSSFNSYEVKASTESKDEVKKHVENGEVECAFVINSLTSYTYYVNNLSMYDTNTQIAETLLQKFYQMDALEKNGLTPEDAAEIVLAQIESKVEMLGKDQMQNFFYTYIMIFALYIVIILYGQMVASNVATEKSSRAMELLVTSADPTAMMFGKVMSSCLVGLLQLIAVFGSAVLFFNINKSFWATNEIMNSIFNIPVDLLVYMLVFFLLGFFVFAFLYGAAGSIVSKMEDINTAVMPVTLIFIFGFMVVMMSMAEGEVDNTLMQICSYIPFTSPMAMFTRIAMSTVPTWQIITSIVILVASVFGIGVLSAKIYKIGVMMYGNKPSLKNVIKIVFKK